MGTTEASADPYDTYRQTKTFGCLDGMRCAAITAVVWHHTVGHLGHLPMFSRGFFGVDLFFIISGFLIVTLLLREEEKNGKIHLKNFYMRRFLRIFPIYYTLLILISIVVIFFRSHLAPNFFKDFPYYATYTSNWHHNVSVLAVSWSLSTEEQFYLFWPAIQRYLRVGALYFLGAFLLVNQAVNFGALRLFLNPEQRLFFESLEIVQCTFTPLCLGIVLAYVLHIRRTFQPCYTLLGQGYSPVVMLGVALVALNLPNEDISGWARLSMQIASALFIGTVVIREDNLFRGILSFPLFQQIGKVSYGMYLYHIFIFVWVARGLRFLDLSSGLLVFAFTLACTFTISQISYIYYEMPFLRCKKKFE